MKHPEESRIASTIVVAEPSAPAVLEDSSPEPGAADYLAWLFQEAHALAAAQVQPVQARGPALQAAVPRFNLD